MKYKTKLVFFCFFLFFVFVFFLLFFFFFFYIILHDYLSDEINHYFVSDVLCRTKQHKNDIISTFISFKCCLIFTLITYKPPSYGDYDYPPFAQALGWLIASLPLLPVPAMACHQLYKTKKLSIIKVSAVKIRKNSDTPKNCCIKIILKFEQCGFTIG